jgi:hypothetical protein
VKRALAALLLASSATLPIAGCPGDLPPPEDDNREPIARLVWPQRWLQGAAAPFDGTGSDDLDGLLVRWSASFGDGTPEQDSDDGTFEHLYTAAGSFDVRLEVEDDRGATAEVLGTVVIVDRIDDPPCSCELACFDDGVCTADGCFHADMSEEATDETGPAPEVGGALTCP